MDYERTLNREEKTELALRELYLEHGYAMFRMSKFEEYDFYAKHKEFLISDRVLTFTDTEGRLMALKPDVTLSIVKSCRGFSPKENEVRRFCYSENVYRVSERTHNFSEIMQSGLECIGDVTPERLNEVVSLAAQSLRRVSDKAVLVLSHLGVLGELLSCVDGEQKDELLAIIGRKSADEAYSFALAIGMDSEKAGVLREIASPEEKITEIEGRAGKYLGELDDVIRAAEGAGVEVRRDLSLVGNMSYYNGIIMRGYTSSSPTPVLSGGQYDKLLCRMGMRTNGVGFAVYLSEI